jgi:RNase P subunit RPR2
MRLVREWRCSQCSKLLGVHDGRRMHIRFAGNHEYLVGLPATGTCRSCGTLNEYGDEPPEPREHSSTHNHGDRL